MSMAICSKGSGMSQTGKGLGVPMALSGLLPSGIWDKTCRTQPHLCGRPVKMLEYALHCFLPAQVPRRGFLMSQLRHHLPTSLWQDQLINQHVCAQAILGHPVTSK